jgi:hypothetical protein
MAWRGNKNKRCGDAGRSPNILGPKNLRPKNLRPKNLGPKNLGPKKLGPKKMRPLSDAATDGDRWGA